MTTLRRQAPHEIAPNDLHDRLLRHEVILVDVREAHEFAAERIHGALLFPLSTFDPLALPADPRRPVVLQCGSGKRSAGGGFAVSYTHLTLPTIYSV